MPKVQDKKNAKPIEEHLSEEEYEEEHQEESLFHEEESNGWKLSCRCPYYVTQQGCGYEGWYR